jgi:hypothetical protein
MTPWRVMAANEFTALAHPPPSAKPPAPRRGAPPFPGGAGRLGPPPPVRGASGPPRGVGPSLPPGASGRKGDSNPEPSREGRQGGAGSRCFRT